MCSAGTQGCFDGSELYCGAPELDIVGGTITITCDDGSTAECSAGTRFCYDNSELYCGVLPTVESVTTTATTTEGEATVVGLTEEQALAEADAAEGTTVTEITTTTTTTTGGEGQPESVGLTEE